MIDITKYKNQGFSEWQIEELRLAEKNGIELELIEKYIANVDYDANQMSEIRKGLLSNVDVSLYSDPNIPYQAMANIRNNLLKLSDLKSESISNLNKVEAEKLKLENNENKILQLGAIAMGIGICFLALVIIILCILVIVFALSK